MIISSKRCLAAAKAKGKKLASRNAPAAKVRDQVMKPVLPEPYPALCRGVGQPEPVALAAANASIGG